MTTTDPTPSPALTDEQHAMLDLEKHWWRYSGSKETEIRARFAISATRYYQQLNALIDTPAALAAEPLLVRRLRRIRAARDQQRRASRAQLADEA
ncbi:DUF3263 domain-containing protein [Nocardioides bruguierae]|uniref:DUF3263 domain-containing protein n=1 Tax=Nocardioides bruguierae TaxID=2945102 RepID=UPI0020201AAA|nr:DUF3263 domain-containing protein [Nocardioides bruguierae]MCL8026294.1 DUF3263 domain-containing protein [Nocardioides bruguierae]